VLSNVAFMDGRNNDSRMSYAPGGGALGLSLKMFLAVCRM
jgi:hypothetical protein